MKKFRLSLSSAAALMLSASAVHAADTAAHWTSCDIGYSEHRSRHSDAGSDVKLGQISCSRTTSSGVIQTFEIGAQADTPPDGRRNPTYSGGRLNRVSGLPSDQRDTFETYVGFGEEFDPKPGGAWLFNVRGGSVNGFSTPLVRGFIDDTHRWLNINDPRHSPLSSSGRPLAEVSGAHTSELLGADAGRYRIRLSDVENATAGSSLDAITLGAQLSIQSAASAAVLPAGLPGLAERVPAGTSLYAGVYAQSTAYDVATQAMGTAREYVYVKAGASLALGKHLVVALEFTHPVTQRVRAQYLDAYNYLGTAASLRF